MHTVLTIFSIICKVTGLCLLLYLIYLTRCRKRIDRSIWMSCNKCQVKWRPTAYGEPAPDDYYCPKCKATVGIKWSVGFLVTNIPEFRE